MAGSLNCHAPIYKVLVQHITHPASSTRASSTHRRPNWTPRAKAEDVGYLFCNKALPSSLPPETLRPRGLILCSSSRWIVDEFRCVL